MYESGGILRRSKRRKTQTRPLTYIKLGGTEENAVSNSAVERISATVCKLSVPITDKHVLTSIISQTVTGSLI